MDVLSDAVAAMRTGRPHSRRQDLYAPWGWRFPASDGTGFHVVLQGSAWLIPAAGEPVAMGPGDVVFLAQGREYGLAGGLDVPLEDVRPLPDGTWPEATPTAPPAPSGPPAVLLCGAYMLDRSRAHPLLAELPDVVHLPARVGAHRSLRTAVELLGAELEEPQPGSDTVVASLLDTLLLYILRAWWLSERHRSGRPTGWAAALADPGVAAALRCIHGDPGHPWTVEDLGARAGLSRAAFARRFAALVGEPPLAYLTWWRMTTAARLLRADDTPLRTIAQLTGYTSEFAFAKAFKRAYGVAPGQYRRQAARTA
ncbi:AraC family transcriptional regulator [Streptomyces cyaneochromogenes]|uniref:AraC family transcriptional regulator n=1 Tax=Streptomyces cyaneochromogenes TaxID=2496836 RepID=A0A3S9MNE7_9ACTN|nr:AraC family transcriptional regulator [Streptomyces cyaneochromogenes]AZQ40712.1 AraC family transcriptional regulator [Streptomyces cyaneochromogenes]